MYAACFGLPKSCRIPLNGGSRPSKSFIDLLTPSLSERVSHGRSHSLN
jgi:hypothetical protein